MMSAIPDDRAREIADAIDAYDQEIADLQSGKRDTYQSLREELEAQGIAKDRVKLEIDALKSAIAIRRKRAKDAAAVEEKDALTDVYLVALSNAPRATHVRVQHAAPSVNPLAAE
jgi:uncharacterized protein (UPF0335 family)